MLPLDLHVLSLPLAFILSQDQTLHCKRSLISWLIKKITCSLLHYFKELPLFSKGGQIYVFRTDPRKYSRKNSQLIYL
jgi:hypothetical protein